MSPPHDFSSALPRVIVGTLAMLLIAWSTLLALHASDNSSATAASPTTASAEAEHVGHEGGSIPVSERLTADYDGVRYCASAALEPFDGAMQQLAETGPGDAAGRFRSCIVETIMYHVSDAELTELDGHLPHFEHCFGVLQLANADTKAAVLPALTTCLASNEQHATQ